MRGRAFGVEIECGYKRGYRAARTLIEKEAAAGKIGVGWAQSFHYDGTLLETCSPILRGPRGFAELRYVMNLLRRNGAYITAEDGMHVHHDAPDFVRNDDKQALLLESWHNNQGLIWKFVNLSRASYRACPAIGKTLVEQKKRGMRIGGRYEVNLSALDEHGSIEFRLHEGCLHFPQAEAWIRFGQSFLNAVKGTDKPLPAMKTCEELLASIRVNKRATSKLLTRGDNETWDGTGNRYDGYYPDNDDEYNYDDGW